VERVGLAVGFFSRPTMADRMDNATEKRRPWYVTAEIREEARAASRGFRRGNHRNQSAQPYRGSKQEGEHRKGRRG
jgi:hypothetical protein